MFLKRAILVNWGNIPKIELEYGPVNLFSGGNGSGKTTAADAIQALMTAAHENLFAFNPGQDETTQRGRGGKQVRTLASYLLGCDDGSYSRLNGTDGYVACVFSPTEGETSEPFTAIMAMRGHLETSGHTKQARLDSLYFVILPGEQLHLSHFVKKDAGGSYITSHNSLPTLLQKEFGPPTIETYEKKGAYLRRLYAILKGRADSVSSSEAKHAARTFAGFMAYKPVKSISEFVAREILEPKNLGDAIRTVSDLMKTVHEMESNARKIKSSVEILSLAKQSASNYIDSWIENKISIYSHYSHQAFIAQKAYLDLKQDQKDKINAIELINSKIKLTDDKRQNVHSSIIQLEAKRQGIQSLRQKDDLEATIEQCKSRLANSAKPILIHTQQLHQNIDSATDLLQHLQKSTIALEIPDIANTAMMQACKKVSQNAGAIELDAYQILNQDWIDLSPLEQTLENVNTWQQQQNKWVELISNTDEIEPDKSHPKNKQSIKDRIHLLVEKRNQQRNKLQQELRKKQQEIRLLNNLQVTYPNYVQAALKAISDLCPSAEPKVLCDFVEVIDTRWQMAIEGYIGGARYSIIVDPEFESQAIEIVRNIKGDRRNNARIIQGRKADLDAQRSTPPKQSIIELMDFSHRTAEDYLKASYGNVVQVDNSGLLRSTPRGITPEGLASGNYSMWRCDIADTDLVFGQAARYRALKAKELEFDTLQIALHNAEELYQESLRASEIIKRIQEVNLASHIQETLSPLRELHQAEQALHELDFSDSLSVEEDLKNEHQNFTDLEQITKKLEQEVGGIRAQQDQLSEQIQNLANNQDKDQIDKEKAESAILEISKILPRFDAHTALKNADLQAESQNTKKVDKTTSNTESLIRLERELFSHIQLHNQTAEDIDKLIYDSTFTEAHSTEFFKQVIHINNISETLHNRLKNNVLIERHRQLSQLKDSFNTAFVTNLCHSIYQAINQGKNILEDLNKELEHHRFGSDREQFYFEFSWVVEYQEYWQFFKAIINTPNLGDGTTLFDIDLPAKHERTRDKLLEMLLDQDAEAAHRELSRISDYRNYRRYEIYKQPENKQPIALSQYGTGSGGQLETPAYIIRAAAVTSAFRFNEGNSHLRMVMVDEAFSKMDETRSREVIHYLTNSLGLQLIFIMPTSKSGPFLDIISNQFVYTKCPTQETTGELKSRVLVDRKECKQEQITKLWSKHRKTIRHQAMLDFMEGI